MRAALLSKGDSEGELEDIFYFTQYFMSFQDKSTIFKIIHKLWNEDME